MIVTAKVSLHERGDIHIVSFEGDAGDCIAQIEGFFVNLWVHDVKVIGN